MAEEKVRVRIAPSPTGEPHVGTASMALFNYVFARSRGGDFVFRIEDTDRARSQPEYEKALLEAVSWLGLSPDEDPVRGGPYAPYRQSERSALYREHAERLLSGGHAYRCFCAKRCDGRCPSLSESEAASRVAAGEPSVVRLRVPDSGETSFVDELRGSISFANDSITHQVLLKSDGFPTYHLANVVDDHLMKITHVIRAEEWISSTPKHVLLYRAFGWEPPRFYHMSLLRNPDRSKISKRESHTSLSYYRSEGFLPEALLNFLGLMGYSMPDGREIFSVADMVASFDPSRLTTTAPVFDMAKLGAINGQHIRSLPEAELVSRLSSFLGDRAPSSDRLRAIAPLIQPRLEVFADFDAVAGFFFRDLSYDPSLLVPKKWDSATSKKVLLEVVDLLEKGSGWDPVSKERELVSLCESLGHKKRDFFMTLRVAITGKTATPPLLESMAALGREVCLARLRAAAGVL